MAEIRQKASLNFMYKAVAEFVARFSFFFFYLIMTNTLGAEEYGRYTKFYSYFSLLLIITDLGLNLVFARDVNQTPGVFDIYFKKVFRLKFFLFVIYIGLCVLLAGIIDFNPADWNFVLLMILFMGTYNLYDSFLYGLVALDQLRYEGMVKSFNRISSAVSGIIIILVYQSLVFAVLSQIAINIISILLILFYIRKSRSHRHVASINHNVRIIHLLKESLPVAVMTFLILIYLRVDIVMLDIFGYETKVIGYYGVIVKVNEMMQIIPTMIMSALFPILNNLFSQDKIKLNLIIQKSMKLVLIVSLVCSVSIFMLGDQIIPFIFGNDFINAVPFGRILFWSFIPFSLSTVLINLSLVNGKQINNMIATIISVGINITLNYFIIPYAGAVGAAISTLTAEIVLCAALITLSAKYTKIIWADFRLFGLLVSVCCFIFSLYVLNSIHFVLNGLISSAVFVFLIMSTKVITIDEKEMFVEMLRLKK